MPRRGPSTRKATIAAKEAFPVQSLVRFTDAEWANRLGTVIGHRKGKVIVLSPPWRRGALPKQLVATVQRRFRVDPARCRLT